MNTNSACVVGIGNPDCGDDSVGPEVIDRLENPEPDCVIKLKASGETAGLIEILSANKAVILIDAMAACTEPGTIHRFDASQDPLPSELFSNYSTHSMGVDQAIEMARVLGDLPDTIIVYGIEGLNFNPGDSMSPEVLNNLKELTNRIAKEISELTLKK